MITGDDVLKSERNSFKLQLSASVHSYAIAMLLPKLIIEYPIVLPMAAN